MKTLILGCGHPDRADDAVGLLVVRKLRALGLNAREYSGDMLSLFYSWAGYDEVVIVDAMESGAPVGSIVVFDPRMVELPRQQFQASTHEFGLAEVVELARSLAQLPPKLTIYGIEAVNCGPGGPVSPEVLRAVDQVAKDILSTIKR